MASEVSVNRSFLETESDSSTTASEPATVTGESEAAAGSGAAFTEARALSDSDCG